MGVADLSLATVLAGNLHAVRDRIARACERAHRDPAAVHLVAVTKTVGLDVVRALAAQGVRDLGENRVQQAAERIPAGPPDVTWHLIGHLQTNKARKAVALFPVIQSIDSARLADAVAAEAERANRQLRVFVEVNASSEEQKSGCEPGAARDLVARVLALPRLTLEGLMTMAAISPDPEAARPCFRTLRLLAEEINAALPPPAPLAHLSMGMSQDFEVAVEEGATVVRIGTALFQGITATA